MEFGTYQMQVFLSLVLILGAALIVLIYDFLKGHNEQLRELSLELKVRRQEENKLIGVLSSLNARLGKAPVEVAAEVATGVAVESAAAQASAAPLETHSEDFLSPEALAVMPEPVARSLPRTRSGGTVGVLGGTHRGSANRAKTAGLSPDRRGDAAWRQMGHRCRRFPAPRCRTTTRVTHREVSEPAQP